MQKFFAVGLALILIGAGCSSSNAPVVKNDGNNNVPPPSPTSYTMAEVTAANSDAKCWTAVDGVVYDLTPALNKHPGGKANIMKLCGKDGTAAFTGKHGQNEKAKGALAGLKIGVLK